MNLQEMLLSRAYELLNDWSETESDDTLEELYVIVNALKEIGYL